MGLAAIQSTRLDERLRRELGASVLAALDDPDVIEIILNPDGTLWLESHGEGMRPAGTEMNAVQAERLVGTVAFALNTVANDQRPVIECELPLDGSRFTGWLPPVVSSPSFVIRKHARLIYTLDDYLAHDIIDRIHSLLPAGGPLELGFASCHFVWVDSLFLPSQTPASLRHQFDHHELPLTWTHHFERVFPFLANVEDTSFHAIQNNKEAPTKRIESHCSQVLDQMARTLQRKSAPLQSHQILELGNFPFFKSYCSTRLARPATHIHKSPLNPPGERRIRDLLFPCQLFEGRHGTTNFGTCSRFLRC